MIMNFPSYNVVYLYFNGLAYGSLMNLSVVLRKKSYRFVFRRTGVKNGSFFKNRFLGSCMYKKILLLKSKKSFLFLTQRSPFKVLLFCAFWVMSPWAHFNSEEHEITSDMRRWQCTESEKMKCLSPF